MRRPVALACVVALLGQAGCGRWSPPIGGIVSWQTDLPENHGLETAALVELKQSLAARRSTAFLVVRNNKIVYEWYARGHGAWRREGTASLAKSLVGGMSLLVGLSDDRIALDDPASRYVPAWRGDPVRSAITIRQLATHSSGLPHRPADRQTGDWSDTFWRRGPGLFNAVLTEAPISGTPGTSYSYSGPGFAVLSYAITASVAGTAEPDIRALLRKRIMEPLGVPGSAWSIGYGRSFELDGLKLYASWSGAGYTARAAARVGQLMLQRGRWEGRQLVDPGWVDSMVTYSGSPLPDASLGRAHPAPAVCWWSNSEGAWPSLPRDAFAGAGAGGQLLLVIPSLELVVVRFGDTPGERSWGPGLWDDLDRLLFSPLGRMAAAGGAGAPSGRPGG